MLSAATEFFVGGGTFMALLILASCIVALVFLDSIVESFPSMMAATLRWKESENINYSVKLSRWRVQSCMALMLPFLLISSRYCLFTPAANPSAMVQFGITTAAMASYLALRFILEALFQNRNMKKDAWKSAVNCPQSFFCILTAIMALTSAIFQFTACPDTIARQVLLWEIGVAYLLSVTRKTQIFVHYRGGFSGFLYLCTLEFIPSGLLIATDILL